MAGRHGYRDHQSRLDGPNQLHNLGLPRVGLKMATGSGKTVVMAMLIAWQTINKVHSPRNAHFAKRFLVVTPGITIKDRLRVLQPSNPANYYRERDLVPADLWAALLQAEVSITNYHSFLLKDDKVIKGVASNTKKLLSYGRDPMGGDPFKESPEQMVARVLADLGGRSGSRANEIVVFNDEAHHCYRDKPLDDPDAVAAALTAEAKKEAKERSESARVWFKGIQAVHKQVGIKAIYDLSATPFYLSGSGYLEGYIFPWVVSDFSLMDAIESGIVKIPRVPIDDDAADNRVTYLRLWDHVGDKLPKKRVAAAKGAPNPHATNPNASTTNEWVPPVALEGALHSLHRSYERAFAKWQTELEALGEPPPVMIVVCPNTVVSKLVFDWVAGIEVPAPTLDEPDRSLLKPGNLDLLSNVVDGSWANRQRTILIDSAQLESGDAMSADFKLAAAHEIDAFKRAFRLSNPGSDPDSLKDEDLLREVMNTVGKKGKLGEHIRCVVSVSMLTEGWDANTVTHVLGIRRFGSQLLCEQVVGRGLRRRSYVVNDDGRFEPEYAEVYGVPFAFIPTSGGQPNDVPTKPPPTTIYAVPERADLRIVFPRLAGYRVEIPDEVFFADFDATDAAFEVNAESLATWTQTGGIVGGTEEQSLDHHRNARPQQVAYALARTLVRTKFTVLDGAERPWLFPQLVRLTRQWLDQCVTFADDLPMGTLLLSEVNHSAAERLYGIIAAQDGNRPEVLQPIFSPTSAVGSTDDVFFATRQYPTPTIKSHVSHFIADGAAGTGGNTWEQKAASLLERLPDVAAFVKNDRMDFTIPYVHAGRTHEYKPDFLVRLTPRPGEPTFAHNPAACRTLIIEMSGYEKRKHDGGQTDTKAFTAERTWCSAINNHGGFGVWHFLEVTDINHLVDAVTNAIDRLHAQPLPAVAFTGLVDSTTGSSEVA